MHGHHIGIGQWTRLAVCVGWLALIGPAMAQEESSVLVDQQAQPAAKGPVLAEPENVLPLPPPADFSESTHVEQPSASAAKAPFMRPIVPRRQKSNRMGLTSAAEPMPALPGTATDVVVRPAPPIVYDTDRRARRMYRDSGHVELVMVTENPADGCWYEIPLCIPACCTGEPSITSDCGIFGRGVVEYCWPCGFTAKVKFRHILGDVRVDYDG